MCIQEDLNCSPMDNLTVGFVLWLCDSSRLAETYHLLIIFSINLSHIIIGSIDQFILNLIHGQGQIFQVTLKRDSTRLG